MIQVSDLFKAASINSHTMKSVVDIYEGSTLVKPGVPLIDGKVNCSREKKIRWDSNIALAYADWQDVDINPDKARYKVYRGISSLGRLEMVQLGEYRIEDVGREQRGQISITGSSLEAYVSDDRFVYPRTPPYAQVTSIAIRDLITESVPGGIVFAPSNTTDRRVSATAPWARERLDSVRTLAESINCDIFVDNAGRFVLQDKPSLSGSVPVTTFRTGKSGMLVTVKQDRSRDKAYNAVAVSSSSSGSDTPPYFAWAYDDDPASPTYWSGPFGHKPRFYSSQFFTSTVQCQITASSMLYEQLAPRETMSFSAPAMIWLVAGDVVAVEKQDGTLANYMLSAVSYGLGVNGTTAASTYTVQDLDDDEA